MTTNQPDRPLVERLLEDGAWLRALTHSVIADPATADDVAQDATVIALSRPPRSTGALRGWLRRVVLNLATDAHRKKVRRAAIEAGLAARDAAADSADLVAGWEIRRQVVNAVLALDEPYRSTLLLRFFEGLDLPEVATRQRVPLETVKTRQRRALDMLRKRLAHLDDGAGRRGFAALLVLTRSDEGTAPFPSAAPIASAALGGLAMSAGTKTVAAAVVLLALGGGWWLSQQRSGRSAAADGDLAAGEAARDPAEPATARAKRRPGSAPSGPPIPENLVAFADFDADRDLRGIVVDRDGQPVVDAQIAVFRFELYRWVLGASRGTPPSGGAPLAEGRSASDGSFRVRLTPGAQTFVRVEAEGFAATELPGLESGRTVRIVLDRPTSLRVRVLEASGAPCAGATVIGSFRRPSPDRSSWSGSSITDADGTVAWKGLARGRSAKVALGVTPPGSRAPVQAECVLEDRDVNELTVTLVEGRAIEGRVVDGTGAAVSGARVFVDQRRAPIATTGSGGEFRIDNWTRDPRWAGDRENRLVAMADGFAPGWADVPKQDDPRPLMIGLRRGYEVTGVVVDAHRRPVAGAHVIAMTTDRAMDEDTLLDTETDVAGTFRLGWLPRDVRTTLSVVATGAAQAVVALTPPPTTASCLDLGTITLSAGQTVRGRVVDEDGVPLSGMYVRLCDPADEGTRVAKFRISADDGRFAFDGVPAGRHKASASGSGPDRSEAIAEVDVVEGADPAPVTIVFGAPPPKPPTKVTLATRIIDEDGHPIPGVLIGVGYGSGGGTGVLKTGNSGTLDIPCDQEPQYVSTRFDGDPGLARRYQYQFVWLRPGTTVTTIALKRAEPVSGTVVDGNGKALAGAWVEALIGSRHVGSGSTDSEGRFAFGVPPGAVVDLEARPASTGSPPTNDVGVCRGVASGATDVTVRVVPVATGRAIDVTLILPEGHAPGKCDVMIDFQGLDRRNNLGAFRSSFDGAGRARFEGLPHAPVRLRVLVRLAGDDEWTYTGLTPVRADSDVTSARVVVPGFRIVRGRVVDETGAPSPGASIFSTAAFNSSATVADESGTFALRLPSDAQPPFLVTASKMPYDRTAPFGGWDIVEDGSDREFEIVLRPQPAR